MKAQMKKLGLFVFDLKIYAIGGLGADERVFSYLKLNFELEVLQWIPPLKKEALADYAKRMLDQIDKEEEFILLGVSFGGMLAVEMAKLRKPIKLILISSAVSIKDIPFLFRVFGKTHLIKLLPATFLKAPDFINNYFFSVKREEDKQLLKQIIHDTDPDFLKWAIGQILSWKGQAPAAQLIRIHGTADRLLNCSSGKDKVEWIEGGGHFMVVDRADEISQLLNSKVEE